MKLLLVSLWSISSSSVGGTERFTVDLAEALTAIGHNVDVLMLSGKSAQINGIRYHSLDIMGGEQEADEYALEQHFGKINNAEALEKIGRYLESSYPAGEYDAIQLNSLLFLAAWSDRPRILTIHTNPYEFDLNWGEGSFDLVSHWIAETKPALTVLTAPSQVYAVEYEGRFKCPVVYIPHAIEPSRVRGRVGSRKLRAKYDLGEASVILMPSRLDTVQKRPQLALEALIQAKSILPEFVAVFTGVDSQYKGNVMELRTRASEFNISTRFIRFDYMAEAYEVSDLVVLPSRSESFGYSALEALFVPRRTVLSAIPSYKEIAEGNPNAHVADGTPESFAKAITAALASPLSPTPKEWAAQYSIETWAHRYLDLLKGLDRG